MGAHTHLPERMVEVRRGTNLTTWVSFPCDDEVGVPAVVRLTVKSEVPKSTLPHYR